MINDLQAIKETEFSEVKLMDTLLEIILYSEGSTSQCSTWFLYCLMLVIIDITKAVWAPVPHRELFLSRNSSIQMSSQFKKYALKSQKKRRKKKTHVILDIIRHAFGAFRLIERRYLLHGDLLPQEDLDELFQRQGFRCMLYNLGNGCDINK
jgi:hypothetical protein